MVKYDVNYAFSAFIVNFEQIPQIVLKFLLLTLNK